jgi:arylsulfatase A-like enzyme
MDIAKEPQSVLDMYGAKPGERSYANNCLLARRLVESGVRFVQLYHWGWDHHGESQGTDIRYALVDRCRETDRANAALITDLKRQGLLDSTLVVWGGEFGRTPMNEERDGSKWLGRDHNQTAFSIWMAGGGIKPGLSFGATDELGYHAVEDRVHVHDLQATILHLLGLNHLKLTYRFQGRDYRLTDVHGNVVKQLLT